MSWAACIAALSLVLSPSVARAQETGAALDDPAAGTTHAEAPPDTSGPAAALGDPHAPAPHTELRPEREPAPPEPWDGPRVELGYTHYVIVDGFGGGDVNAGFFGGYLPTGRVRLGGSAELGSRDYSLGQSDLLLRATLLVGYQHLPLRPFVPYAGVVGTAGVLIGKRFRTPVADAILGMGLEIGADVNLARTLYLGLGLSWLRAALDGLGHDLWVIRLRIGL